MRRPCVLCPHPQCIAPNAPPAAFQVLPILVVLRRSAEMQRYAQALSVTESQWIRRHFAHVFALTCAPPDCAEPQPAIRKALRDYLKQQVTHELAGLVHDNVDTVLQVRWASRRVQLLVG